jgi:uncharacterized protein with PIN domain
MSQVTLIFHGKLNDFFNSRPPGEPITWRFEHKVALKHIIEALGVPHPEVGLIKRDNVTLALDYPVNDGDVIDIFPRQPGEFIFTRSGPKFILDNHLGKLTDYLRLLGFDAAYARDLPDEQIARVSAEQSRVLLTRDRGLLKRKIVGEGYCVRADDPEEQLAEVVEQFQLSRYVTPFQRCPRCNGKLSPVDKEIILDRLLPLTKKYYDEFTQCEVCGQIYWKGSHFENMQSLLKPYLDPNSSGEKK